MITRRVVRTLAIRLTEIEQKRAFAKPTDDLVAYDLMLQGQAHLDRLLRADNYAARKLFQQAIKRDADYASAYAGLGWTHFNAVTVGWTGAPQAGIKQAYDLAQKAISLDAFNVDGRRLLSKIYSLRRQHDLALIETERMIAINPNDAESYAEQGMVLVYAGQIDGAILSLETAMRFDPVAKPRTVFHLGLAFYLKGRYAEAVAMMQKAVTLAPNAGNYMVLAASYAQNNQLDEAAVAAAAVRRLNPFFSVETAGSQFRDPAHAARLVEGLLKAGLD